MANGEFALEHKTRRMIYNYILEHPGASFGRIRKVFDLTAGTLRYHLKYLKKAEKIDSRLEEGKRCYYTLENKIDSPAVPGANLNPTQKHLLTIIKDNPGITKKELAKKTRFKSPTVAYNVKKLVEFKLVWKSKQGKATGYEFITKENFKEELRNLLLKRFLAGEVDEETFLELIKRLE